MKSDKDMILQDIKSLLQFQLKQAKRHGLEYVKLTVPRARLFIREINKANKVKPARASGQIWLDNLMKKIQSTERA